MVYLDTSVALAFFLSEDVRPPDRIWSEALVASRLTEYELATRLRGQLEPQEATDAREAVSAHVSFIDLSDVVVGDALRGLPEGLRTLDALHLASVIFLRDQGVDIRVATYDRRLAGMAEELGLRLYPLEERTI